MSELLLLAKQLLLAHPLSVQDQQGLSRRIDMFCLVSRFGTLIKTTKY